MKTWPRSPLGMTAGTSSKSRLESEFFVFNFVARRIDGGETLIGTIRTIGKGSRGGGDDAGSGGGVTESGRKKCVDFLTTVEDEDLDDDVSSSLSSLFTSL